MQWASMQRSSPAVLHMYNDLALALHTLHTAGIVHRVRLFLQACVLLIARPSIRCACLCDESHLCLQPIAVVINAPRIL